MKVDLSKCDISIGVSFFTGGENALYCDYGGVVESGETLQSALDSAINSHNLLCYEEDIATMRDALERIATCPPHSAGQTPNEFHFQKWAEDALEKISKDEKKN